jgi:hypothetical protein
MKRSAIVCGLLASVLVGLAASGTIVGLGVGLDPTGILMFSALTEVAISESFSLRAEAGIATDEVVGLMLATAAVLFHAPVPPVDPFIGIGAGAALTPPPFSTGIVAEGIAGVRVIAFRPVSLFAQLRYVVRWSGAGVTTGPIYEAGALFQF